MPGCSPVRRGGWQRFVADANDSLMGILQTARKCVGNSILLCCSCLYKRLHSWEKKNNHLFFTVSSDLKVLWGASGAGTEGGGWRVACWSTALPPPVDSAMLSVQTQRASSGTCGGLCRAGCVWRAGVAGHSCGNPVFSVESALVSTDAILRTQTSASVSPDRIGISQEPKKTVPKKQSQHNSRDKTQCI